MKEKRYFCNLALKRVKRNKRVTISLAFIISFGVITMLSSIIYSFMLLPRYGKELELYAKKSYGYLDQVISDVIKQDKIDISAIPEDVGYQIEDKKDHILFTCYLKKQDLEIFPTSVSTKVTLSKDLKILDQQPNIWKEYVVGERLGFAISIPIFGLVTWMIIASLYGIINSLLILFISLKKLNTRKSIS